MLLAGLVDGDVPNAFGSVTAGTPDAGRAVVDRYHADRFEQMKLYSLLQPDVVTAIVRPLLANQPVRVTGTRDGKALEWVLVNAGACPV